MTYDNLVNSIESLPLLSNATFFIQKLYQESDGNVDIVELVEIIESDALLTANILKMINAPFYGFSKIITSVSQAVTLFGTQKVYGIVIHYALRKQMKANTKAYGISPEIFNDVCHLQSTLMMEWYTKINKRQAQFLAPLAFIMETGKLIVAQEIDKSDYVEEFKIGYKNCSDPEVYEDSLLDTTSYYLSGMLFNHWNLDPTYVEILKGLDYENEKVSSNIDNYIKILNIIRTAVNAKEILTKRSVLKACKLVKEMGLDVNYFVKIALQTKKDYVENLKNR